MDKLRAIEYFNCAAQTSSFAAAARALEVTTPAVVHLIASLERSLGVRLFYRSTRGIALTPDGERYYEASSRLTAGLIEVEQQLRPRGKLRGTLTVGMFGSLAQNCVMPRIATFLERYPEIELLAKSIPSTADLDAHAFDIALMTGWPPERDYIVRPLAQSRNVICASPSYWNRMGRPQEPEALKEHHCLVFRSSGGAFLDRWEFERNGERRSIDVSARLLTDSSTWIDQAACTGAGVIRRADLSVASYLASGMLEAVLTDWDALDAPAHFAVYRRGQRQSRTVRAFLDFAFEIFADMERNRPNVFAIPVRSMPKPDWYERARGRQSAYAGRARAKRCAPN